MLGSCRGQIWFELSPGVLSRPKVIRRGSVAPILGASRDYLGGESRCHRISLVVLSHNPVVSLQNLSDRPISTMPIPTRPLRSRQLWPVTLSSRPAMNMPSRPRLARIMLSLINKGAPRQDPKDHPQTALVSHFVGLVVRTQRLIPSSRPAHNVLCSGFDRSRRSSSGIIRLIHTTRCSTLQAFRDKTPNEQAPFDIVSLYLTSRSPTNGELARHLLGSCRGLLILLCQKHALHEEA